MLKTFFIIVISLSLKLTLVGKNLDKISQTNCITPSVYHLPSVKFVNIDEVIENDNIVKEKREISNQDLHNEHNFEVGFSLGPTHFINEKKIAAGFHLHLLYNINSDFTTGLGFEKILDEHNHTSLGVILGYSPIENTILNLSPSITFEDNIFSKYKFSGHIEAIYTFDFEFCHLGPALEFAFDKEDIHYSLGLHLGIGF